MSKTKNISKLIAITCFVMLVDFSMASFSITGFILENLRNNKYSLRTLQNYSNRGVSISLLKSNLLYKGNSCFSVRNNSNLGIIANSMVQFERGNTTYVLPFKTKFKNHKFKTPSQATF